MRSILPPAPYGHVLGTFRHSSHKNSPCQCLAASAQKHDPYWGIPLNEDLPEPVIDLPLRAAGEEPRRRTSQLFDFQTTSSHAGSGEWLTEQPVVKPKGTRERT